MQKLLISGGAGFVGSSLALAYREKFPKLTIVAFDNLHRRGSERNLDVFRRHQIQFVHGDIRNPNDFDQLEGNFDFFIEASAEPSVHAGTKGSPHYVLETNLVGTVHALEFARRRAPNFLFLSTSRVYSMAPLQALPVEVSGDRLEIKRNASGQGFSGAGISEKFPTDTARSFYGASKLASELLVQEYAAQYQMNAVINRSGVIAGPGQFGKVDQGVFTLWLANHYFGKELAYFGYGGKGHQVRDLLHPRDLFDLLEAQRNKLADVRGEIFNIGGGSKGSVSLAEWTKLAVELSGKSVPIRAQAETANVDVPYYVTDNSKVSAKFGWSPKRGPREIASDIHNWITAEADELRSIFGG